MDPIQAGANPPKDRWINATGTIMGEVGGPYHLASIVLLSYPPKLGAGIRLKGIDPETLNDLHRQDNRYWTSGSYRITASSMTITPSTRIASSRRLIQRPNAEPERPGPTRPIDVTRCADVMRCSGRRGLGNDPAEARVHRIR